MARIARKTALVEHPDQLSTEGGTALFHGSAAEPYVLTNHGMGSFSCTCPAWRNQKVRSDRRTCKHLRAVRGDAVEESRIATNPDEAPTSAEAIHDVFARYGL